MHLAPWRAQRGSPHFRRGSLTTMKRIIGIVIGVFYALLSGLAFTTSTLNWSVGNSDLGLWWAVIGTLLGIAGVGALLGTWFHTRPVED